MVCLRTRLIRCTADDLIDRGIENRRRLITYAVGDAELAAQKILQFFRIFLQGFLQLI